VIVAQKLFAVTVSFFFVLFFRFDNFDKKVVGELILKKSQ